MLVQVHFSGRLQIVTKFQNIEIVDVVHVVSVTRRTI